VSDNKIFRRIVTAAKPSDRDIAKVLALMIAEAKLKPMAVPQAGRGGSSSPIERSARSSFTSAVGYDLMSS
jgi:hypothetical protein